VIVVIKKTYIPKMVIGNIISEFDGMPLPFRNPLLLRKYWYLFEGCSVPNGTEHHYSLYAFD